jgi:hypothetical protein
LLPAGRAEDSLATLHISVFIRDSEGATHPLRPDCWRVRYNARTVSGDCLAMSTTALPMTVKCLSASSEDRIRRMVGTFYNGASYETITPAALDCLRRISASQQLSAFIDGRARLAIEHQNGFLKLPLYEPPDGAFRLRLHFWTAGRGAAACPDIHNHTRDYWSLVLAGRLKIEEFAPSPTGDKYHEYLASNRTPDRRYTFSYRGVTRHALTDVRKVAVGEFHSAPHSTFHRVRILLFPACTLFLQGPERCSSTVVLSSRMRKALEAKALKPSGAEFANALKSAVF